MKKFWMIYQQVNDAKLVRFDDKDEAIAEAKRKAHQSNAGDPVYVLEAVIVARRPIPDIETTEIK